MMDKECYLIFVNISELDNTVDMRKHGNVESNEKNLLPVKVL